MITTPKDTVARISGSFEWDICGWSVTAKSLKEALACDVGHGYSLLSKICEERFDFEAELRFAHEENEDFDDDQAWMWAQESFDTWVYDLWTEVQREDDDEKVAEIMFLDWGENLTITAVECDAGGCGEMVEFHPLVCDNCGAHFCEDDARDENGDCFCGHEFETMDLMSESIDFFKPKADADNGGKADDITQTHG